ncbi:MAG: hypothetical protein GX640_23665 [Fibrobacter sp.]|nr:hypothetical protein [Fibrobacter sp.]
MKFLKTIFITVLSVSALSAEHYVELVPGFNRMKSNAMVRKISHPTLAALDYAAYTANPVLFEIQKFKPQKPAEIPNVSSITFNGLLKNTVSTLDSTPLTDEEKLLALAWRPMTKRIFEFTKTGEFSSITSGINGYKWSDPSIAAPYQEITTAFFHTQDTQKQLWVKIEFSPWVTFIKDLTDSDNDGIKEIYGQLPLDNISSSTIDSIYTWVKNQYAGTILNHEQIIDWITDLASYWYPAKNTDILEEDTVWPNERTEKQVKKTMRGKSVSNPVAIVRGRPFGKPVYNVYVIDNAQKPVTETGTVPQQVLPVEKRTDTTSSIFIRKNDSIFTAELASHTSYKHWEDELSTLLTSEREFLKRLPPEQMGYPGKNGWLFFRKDLEYSTGGDLSSQLYDKNPLPHLIDLNRFLHSQNVSFLFVAVPNKTEVYHEQLPFETSVDSDAIINPYSRKILKDLQDSGVEVIDLLPAFLNAKSEDGISSEPVYQKQDTHWSSRGLRIAAEMIAERIKSYSWYAEAVSGKNEYQSKDTTVLRQGDLVERLDEALKINYPPAELTAHQIRNADGTLFKSSKDAPVILMGDSFTGVYESTDCKAAGVGANIAYKTGLPLDIITSWGGGPLVRERLIRQRKASLGSKRLVVYMMVARDLYNYDQNWAPLQSYEEK